MGNNSIDARDTDKIENLSTGKKTTLTVKTDFKYHIIEMEDINFHFDSAVLLPDYGPDAPKPGTPEQNRITGLGVLYACYKFSEKNNYKLKILIAGHTDKKGSAKYNVELSELRSKNIYAALNGDKIKWVEICVKKHKIEDYQQILKWVHYNRGWDCDPGQVNNTDNEQTRNAVKNFQEKFNKEYKASVPENGKVGKETWGAFFEIYTDELTQLMGVDRKGLQNIQMKLQFILKDGKSPAPRVGCGEYFPANKTKTNSENNADRRVELLFFDESDLPELKCHPDESVCDYKKCDIYNTKLFKRVPVPIDPPGVPDSRVVKVFLQLKYKDPETKDLTFPKDFPVTVSFPDGSSQNEITDKDGKLKFSVNRLKKSFTLNFSGDKSVFIAHPTKDSPKGSTDIVFNRKDLSGKLSDKYNIFKLPIKWSLADSDWEVKNTSAYKKPDFSGFDGNSKDIGSEASPIELLLDPHWQHFQFIYFDRWIKSKLNILQIMIEGFRDSSKTSGKASTQSNWMTGSENNICLPWILQNPPKPDKNILVRFRTLPGTFIESTDDTNKDKRKYVTQKTSGPLSDDALINAGEFLDKDFNAPEGKRLAYYDMPEVWKSGSYFAQLSGGKNADPVKHGKFEDLAGEKTEDGKPLIISLDDIVLTDNNLNPVKWIPDDKTENRYSIFRSNFSNADPDSSKFSTEGLFKPDKGNKKGWVTELPTLDTGRNYLAEYPDPTRLIITQGNFFDVFNKRTPDKEGHVVGARAAVRIINVFDSSITFVPPETTRGRVKVPSNKKSFFSEVQPLFEQDYVNSDHIGRFDLMQLRCCGVDTDGVTELGICLVFIRYFFDFSPHFKAFFNPKAVPLKLAGNDANDWVENAMTNLMHRWNGPDSITAGGANVTLNPGNGEIIPVDSGKEKFKSKIIWFAQQVDLKRAHFHLGIFQDATDPNGVRAYMVPDDGTGALDKSDNVAGNDGWFTFAHESGHGGSLMDEYIEPNGTLSDLPGFDSNSPGSPFDPDTTAMMNSNQQVRPRHYWYLAEWFRQLRDKKSDYKIKHGSFDYSIPHLTGEPYKNYIGWPAVQKKNIHSAGRQNFDVFLYPLGKEKYSAKVLTASLAPNSEPFDGIMIILVKMKFSFTTKKNDDINNFLNNIHGRIHNRFDFKVCVKGKQDDITYKRCLLFFSPRYYADHFSNTKPTDFTEHFRINVVPSGTAQWDNGKHPDNHKLIIPITSPNLFSDFFGNMLGLSKDQIDKPAEYLSIAQNAIQNAETPFAP